MFVVGITPKTLMPFINDINILSYCPVRNFIMVTFQFNLTFQGTFKTPFSAIKILVN